MELNPFYSMVPVTGVALLLQRLISPDPHQVDPWLYFIPVLAPMVIYSWLALRWAIEQFQREEVLFREAERLDVGLWLRRLFREKEALPTAGQAFFCFALLMVLRWLSLGFGRDRSVLDVTAVCQLAFTAAPPLFMALLLTTRPRQGLALRLPPWWSWPAAAVLAVLCVPPLAWLTLLVLDQFPALKQLLQEYHPARPGRCNRKPAVRPSRIVLVHGGAAGAVRGAGVPRLHPDRPAPPLPPVDGGVPEQLPLRPLPDERLPVRHRISSSALVLALIALRTGSVAPAMVFHLVYNLCIVAPLMAPRRFGHLSMETRWRSGLPSRRPRLLTAMMGFGKRPAVALVPEKIDSPTRASANGAAATDAVQQAPS